MQQRFTSSEAESWLVVTSFMSCYLRHVQWFVQDFSLGFQRQMGQIEACITEPWGLVPFSVTLNDPTWFQGHTILRHCICQKWYEIHRDLHTPYSTLSFSVTLSDLAKYCIQWHEVPRSLWWCFVGVWSDLTWPVVVSNSHQCVPPLDTMI